MTLLRAIRLERSRSMQLTLDMVMEEPVIREKRKKISTSSCPFATCSTLAFLVVYFNLSYSNARKSRSKLRALAYSLSFGACHKARFLEKTKVPCPHRTLHSVSLIENEEVAGRPAKYLFPLRQTRLRHSHHRPLPRLLPFCHWKHHPSALPRIEPVEIPYVFLPRK